MAKRLFLLVGTMLVTAYCYAQFPYTFTAFKQTYTPLTTGTEYKPGQLWGDTDMFVTPIPFHFKMDTITCDTFFSQSHLMMTSPANPIASLLAFCEKSFEDRGNLTGTSALSPVRYLTTGLPGDRIFKTEVYNAGFSDERTGFGTMNDSVCVQIWLYERSKAIELRYGPSKISHSSNYFVFGDGPFIAYVMDIDDNNNGKLYVLNGDPDAPDIDSLKLVNGNPDNTINPLNRWPSDGTVYRFTPKTNVVFQPEKLNAKVYPTLCSDQLNIELAGNNATSYSIIAINGMTTNINGTIKNGKESIDVSTLPAGMYIVQMHNDTSTGVYKFTKL